MGLIKLDFNSLEKTANEFKESNEIILKNMKLIYNELVNLPSILDTPKSSKIIEEQIKSMEQMEKYTQDKSDYLSGIFNMAKDEYMKESESIKKAVGDKNA